MIAPPPARFNPPGRDFPATPHGASGSGPRTPLTWGLGQSETPSDMLTATHSKTNPRFGPAWDGEAPSGFSHSKSIWYGAFV